MLHLIGTIEHSHHDIGDSGDDLLAGHIVILWTHEKKPVDWASHASFLLRVYHPILAGFKTGRN